MKIKIKKKNVIKVLAIIVILVLIYLIINLISNIREEKVAGNKSNRGLVAYDNGTTFYNLYEKGIVKWKNNKEYQITDETAYSINIVGDNLYYLTVSNENGIDIKTVQTNGNGLKKIKSISTSISKIYVQDGYIYYATNKNTNGIAKISLENNEETLVTTANIQDFQVVNDEIYFTDNVSFLYKMSLNGTDVTRISTDLSVKNFQILGKWLYFIDTQSGVLNKVKLDGTEKTVVSDKIKNENYNVTSKKIYFFDAENKKICSVNLKGNSYKELATIKSSNPKINIADGKLYYLDLSEDESQIYQIHRIKTNGGKAKKIEY